ncbi:hypothetical protein [Halorubrum vacuolatum]|uniref:Uncharacterized protein n=1 Tax=Halorubrum vacuolatum TaxID=63740 RepID=A0A238VP80_HALVU|nr:hypothetical protein [Halorubrum vacuolatum]SNR36162.1 hypothetical protein SAMN06264855_103230 [Halorubrum vacuolatum]
MEPRADGSLVPEENRKWFRLGVAVAVAWVPATLALLVLFELDPALGLAGVVVGGVVFGIAFTVFVLYVY